MGVVSVLASHVAEGQDVQLLLPCSAGGVDGEQHRPGDAASNEADDGHHLEVTQVKVAIERLMLQDVGIVDVAEGTQPIQQPIGSILCLLAAGC